MNLDIYSFVLISVFLLTVGIDGARYYRHSEGSGPRGELGQVRNDCPVQCRCIALAHLSYRDMAERWLSMRRMHGVQNTFKGTESPVWKEDAINLQGRDVVCMGLNKIPRPLPNRISGRELEVGQPSVGSLDRLHGCAG